MTVRSALPFILLFNLFSICAAPGAEPSPASAARRFPCPRKAFALAYAPPSGWTGPVYAGGPVLDSWTFSRGPSPAPDTLETRIYDAQDSFIRWDTASNAEILANFKDYNHPRIERLPDLSVDGHPARVLVLHSVGIEEYLANVYFGDSLVSVMLTSNTRAGLARQRAAFLAFVRSLRFEKSR